MEFTYLVCVGGISFGTMGVFQYLYASATGGPDERFWASPVHFWDALASRFSLSS